MPVKVIGLGSKLIGYLLTVNIGVVRKVLSSSDESATGQLNVGIDVALVLDVVLTTDVVELVVVEFDIAVEFDIGVKLDIVELVVVVEFDIGVKLDIVELVVAAVEFDATVELDIGRLDVVEFDAAVKLATMEVVVVVVEFDVVGRARTKSSGSENLWPWCAVDVLFLNRGCRSLLKPVCFS